MITLSQGEAVRVYISINQDGAILNPNMVTDIEFRIGSDFSRTYRKNGVTFDEERSQWCIFPGQLDTAEMKPGEKPLSCRIKYPDGTVLIRDLDTVKVQRTVYQEEL